MTVADHVLIGLFATTQILYFLSFAVDGYFFTRPVNWVDTSDEAKRSITHYPYIVLFYPVLRELEETMRTTFISLSQLEYPRDRFTVIAIPNDNDVETVASLKRLQTEFPFVRIIEVPPTTHSSWNKVWIAWEKTPKAYWWHQGRRRHVRALPPKKTRQLIYAYYQVAAALLHREDFLVNYIDADSCPPRDHFLAAAIGMRDYDVLQAQNVAGNLNDTLAASWHAFDHMAWDGSKYPHLSADGKHPYWVLGKGLFFRASDLMKLCCFHPWLTIEDPEVGMRFWVNGKKLGVISGSLVEEVPSTFAHGITQRKRWVAGFFQSLGSPLRAMGMRRRDRVKAWLNFLPCMSLWLNALGLPIGIWALWSWSGENSPLPLWFAPFVAINIYCFVVSMTVLYMRIWKRTELVLNGFWPRVWYMLRINPLFVLVWWVMWLIPLAIGLRMYLRDEGLVWERTEKTDANNELVRVGVAGPAEPAPAPEPAYPALAARLRPATATVAAISVPVTPISGSPINV